MAQCHHRQPLGDKSDLWILKPRCSAPKASCCMWSTLSLRMWPTLSLRMAPSWQQHTTTFSPVLADADTREHHTAGGTRRTIKWVTLRVDARHPRPRNDMYLHAGGEFVRRVIVDQGMTCIFTQAVGLCSMSSLDPQTKLAAPDGRSNGSRCEWTQGIHDDMWRGFAVCMKMQQEWMQLCDATDPVWPGEDHATLDHLGLYGRAGCCQSPQGSSPNDEGTGLPPHLRARLALLPCHRPIFLPLDPHDVRSKGCKASCALEDEESVEPGVKHDRILVEGGPQGDLAKRLSRNQPCVASGIWTPAAKSRLT